MQKRLYSLLIVGFLVGMSSCSKVQFGNIEPQLALPVFNSQFGIRELFGATDSSEVSFSPDGQVSLIYDGKPLDIPFNALYAVPITQAIVPLVNSTEARPTLTPGETVVFKGQSSIALNNESGKLSALEVGIGKMIAGFSSNIPHNLNVKLIFPTIQSGGAPLVISASSAYSGGVHQFVAETDLAKAMCVFNETAIEYNTLTVQYEVGVTKGSENGLNIGDKVDMNFSFSTSYYYRAEGFLNLRPVEITERDIFMRLFQNTIGDYLENVVTFTDPRLELNFDNPHNVGGQVSFSELKSVDDAGVTSADIVGNQGNQFLVNPSNAPGTPLRTQFVFDRNTSNIHDVLTPTEELVRMKGSIVLQNPVDQKTVLTGLKTAKLTSRLILPLIGFSNNWAVADTVDVNFENINLEDGGVVSDVLFKINTDNALPVNVDLQIYFYSNNGVLIDSLFNGSSTGLMIASGTLDGNGRVAQGAKNTNDVTVNKARFERIAKAKKAYVRAALKTGGNNSEVKLFADNYFGVKLGVKSTFSIDIN